MKLIFLLKLAILQELMPLNQEQPREVLGIAKHFLQNDY